MRRKTWAPRGQTPVQYAWDRHDRLSVISALTVSPRQRRLRLFFQIHTENIRTQHVVQFLRQLHRHLRRRSLVVWDRWNVHRSAAARLQIKRPDWFEFEWLPAYAPELNPVEQVWNHVKYADLANYIPKDLLDLDVEVDLALTACRDDQDLLQSCFRYAKLSL